MGPVLLWPGPLLWRLMRYAVLLLLCLGCSSPTTYNQSASRPPPPPRFSPVEDAPHTFRPGQPIRRPDVQPQPRPKRYLPPEPDGRPGIWASESRDPPGWSEPAPTIKVLDVEIEMPPEVQTRWDATMAVHCAYIMDLGMRTNLQMLAELRHRPNDVRCMAAVAFHYCALSLGERRRKEINDEEHRGVASDAALLQRYRIDSVQNAARAALVKECGVPLPEWAVEVRPILEAMQHGRASKVLQ